MRAAPVATQGWLLERGDPRVTKTTESVGGGGTMCFPGEMVSFDFSKELKPNCKGVSGRSNGGTKAFVHRRVEYWINAFRNLRVTVVGDSIGRHFMKAFVKMLGGGSRIYGPRST